MYEQDTSIFLNLLGIVPCVQLNSATVIGPISACWSTVQLGKEYKTLQFTAESPEYLIIKEYLDFTFFFFFSGNYRSRYSTNIC